MKAKNWWKNNAEEWLAQIKEYEDGLRLDSKHFKKEEDFFVDAIEDYFVNNPEIKVLEVGAGNGRIIGKLSKLGIDGSEFYNCSSIDINPKLSEYIKKKYPRVKTYIGEIIDLPYHFKDREFDLVFTHEVLQHIDPSEIDKAVSELKRVGKEVWCMENWRDAQENGEKVSDSHCGRWNYDLKKYFNIYYDFYTDWGQMFIKSRE